MIIPYKANISADGKPISNYVIMIAVALAFSFQVATSSKNLTPLVLKEWSLAGLVGHMWLHKNIFHIIMNLLFLWVFGNAVCSKIGNVIYPCVYISLGLFAGMAHLFFDKHPVIGASGAIFGLMGIYLVLCPYNSIRCVLLLIPFIRRFSIAAVWIIGWWFILNLVGALTGYTAISGIAYITHVGGFLSGAVLALILVKLKLATRARDEEWYQDLWQ